MKVHFKFISTQLNRELCAKTDGVFPKDNEDLTGKSHLQRVTKSEQMPLNSTTQSQSIST